MIENDQLFIATPTGLRCRPSVNLPLGKLANKLSALLEWLSVLHPKLAVWRFDSPKPKLDGMRVLSDWSNLAALIGESAYRQSDRHLYRHLGPDGRFTSESVVEGAGVEAGVRVEIEEADPPRDGSAFCVTATSFGEAGIAFRGGYFEELATLPMVRRLMDVLIEVWRPERLEVSTRRLRCAAFSRALRSEQAILAGWINYVRNPGVERLLPPEIDSERLPDGGLLVLAGREPPNPDDPGQVARVRRLQDVLGDLFPAHSSSAAMPGPAAALPASPAAPLIHLP